MARTNRPLTFASALSYTAQLIDRHMSPPYSAGHNRDLDPESGECVERERRTRIGDYPVTPDGRYFVVRGRLWRLSDPSLGAGKRAALTRILMTARREIARARREDDEALERQARSILHEAKVALGERGRPWWSDGAPDYSRFEVGNSPYRDWYLSLGPHG